MRNLTEQLATYRSYHLDRRNVATHAVGIPLIVLAVSTLLSRVHVGPTSLAVLAMSAAALFYLKLDLRFGVAMSVWLTLSNLLGAQLASGTATQWLANGLGLFIGGWILQFIGHYFEGRKPAFVDDLIGLLIGPLFVLAELVFALGLREELHEEIVQHA